MLVFWNLLEYGYCIGMVTTNTLKLFHLLESRKMHAAHDAASASVPSLHEYQTCVASERVERVARNHAESTLQTQL